MPQYKAVLFDWGDTLMRDLRNQAGAMAVWPVVEALPGATAALAKLQPAYTICLATNAEVSQEPEIRAALKRVGLDEYVERVYCFRSVGHCKPSAAFFHHIVDDLGLQPAQVVMVGDNWQIDVLGAAQAGLAAVWLNETGDERRSGAQPTFPARVETIFSLEELPQAVQRLEEP